MSVSIASPRRAVPALIANIVLIAIAVLFLIPMLWVVLSSVNANAQMAIEWPTNPSLKNFSSVLTWETTGRPLLNGLAISFGAAAIVVVLSTLAAYPLSRYNARYNSPFLYSVLFASSLPITAIMVPVYALFVTLNLVDSPVGVTLFMAATGLPYAIWMMKNFMDSVPISLEEAAWVDGASAMGALRRIVLPLMGPGITAVFIFNFIEFWGNFFVPFVLLIDPAKLPISVSIYSFFGSHGLIVYGQLAAFSLIYTAPVILLYVLVGRSLNGAFRLSGGVKG